MHPYFLRVGHIFAQIFKKSQFLVTFWGPERFSTFGSTLGWKNIFSKTKQRPSRYNVSTPFVALITQIPFFATYGRSKSVVYVIWFLTPYSAPNTFPTHTSLTKMSIKVRINLKHLFFHKYNSHPKIKTKLDLKKCRNFEIR